FNATPNEHPENLNVAGVSGLPPGGLDVGGTGINPPHIPNDSFALTAGVGNGAITADQSTALAGLAKDAHLDANHMSLQQGANGS
ncbi:hypothetical protein ABTA56_19445, partial [Acinetobacter baumannii]